ncbi:hypothetical protein F6X40_10890 [Paraburkholderia sp. UCT31]|uniref:hypothetical protein n=1 Tax=Paraburkholderia sp. UCT31 TaxID=2615209 RepID=UPI001655B96A|nr:hypothetical protein [Paraburkholderia sp. UCT31]MBC8737313.1 hypothetical protein [Paraburkholderia sp. UCT31]
MTTATAKLSTAKEFSDFVFKAPREHLECQKGIYEITLEQSGAVRTDVTETLASRLKTLDSVLSFQ